MAAKPRKILIVDPDAFLAGIYARRFELGKWNVRVAETATEARKILVRNAPDAILVDVEAIGDSVAFLHELRDHPKAKHSVVVALATIGQRKAIEDARKAGADAYLLKGHFVPSEVRAKVERLVTEKNVER